MKTKHTKMNGNLKIIAKMRAWRNETTACQETPEACLEKTEATDLEANPKEIRFEAEREEIRKE
jgi:hypothetical protein